MPKERIHFDFDKEALKRLDAMRKNGENRAEVIRRALRVLEWLDQFSEDTQVIMKESGEDDFGIRLGELTHAK